MAAERRLRVYQALCGAERGTEAVLQLCSGQMAVCQGVLWTLLREMPQLRTSCRLMEWNDYANTRYIRQSFKQSDMPQRFCQMCAHTASLYGAPIAMLG